MTQTIGYVRNFEMYCKIRVIPNVMFLLKSYEKSGGIKTVLKTKIMLIPQLIPHYSRANFFPLLSIC